MGHVVTAIGIIFLVLGVVNLVRPATIRSLINFAKVGRRVYIGGLVRIIIGLLLLLGASVASVPLIPIIVGIVACVSGILIYVLGRERMHAFLAWWQVLPDNKLRIVPVIAAIIGILLIYSV